MWQGADMAVANSQAMARRKQQHLGGAELKFHEPGAVATTRPVQSRRRSGGFAKNR
jgi:hypothetical protein